MPRVGCRNQVNVGMLFAQARMVMRLGDERLNMARLHLGARLVTRKPARLTDITAYEPE